MPRRKSSPRRLVAGEHTYLWWVRRVAPYHEMLRIRREGELTELRLSFRQGEGRLAADVHMASGQLWLTADDRMVNLNQPGTVRMLVDAALAGGWDPAAGDAEIDGWPLL